jgi:DNA-binding NtrC family response regulator
MIFIQDNILLSNIGITKSIIVVEDERDLVALLGSTCRSGYKISAFTNPLSALAHIHKNSEKYNLLLSDFSMKTMNGCDLAI